MGGKSATCAHNSGAPLAAGSASPVPGAKAGVAPCKQHWVGVRVEDEDGKVLKDVKVRMSMTDGSDMTVNFATQALGADGSYKTDKAFPSGDCEFSIPAVQDAEWWPLWPKGDPAAQVAADASHDVEEGDCVVNVGEIFGFRNYHSFWDHSRNKALKDSRKNANALAVDDAIALPDSKKKTVAKKVDHVWTFVVKKHQLAKLRIVLFGGDDKPLSGIAWKLKTPVAKSGTTGADGLIEIADFPRLAKKAELEITLTAATKFGKVANVAGTATDYPPKLKHEQFTNPSDLEPPGRSMIDFKLALGSLPAFDAPGGALARLHNLGFGCRPDSDEKQITRSVKAYQRLYKNEKAGSGKPADIQADVRDLHDKP